MRRAALALALTLSACASSVSGPVSGSSAVNDSGSASAQGDGDPSSGDTSASGDALGPSALAPPVPAADVCVGATFTDPKAAGAGTRVNPYIICTPAQLATLAHDAASWSDAYRLGNDIDMSSIAGTFTGIGTTDTPFSGYFDGAKHHVTNLHMSASDPNCRAIGFFGAIVGGAAAVQSLAIDNAVIDAGPCYEVGVIAGRVDRGRVIDCASSGAVTGGVYVGGLIGRAMLGATVASASSAATVTSDQYAVGGLIGDMSEGVFVANSYAAGAVNGGDGWIGGLVGQMHGSVIVGSYSSGDVRGTNDGTGGFVGQYCGIIQHSFATGNVTAIGTSAAGLFAGTDHCGELDDVYVSSTATCSGCGTPADSAIARTSQQLRDRSQPPLAGWDFANVWAQATPDDWPTLAPTLFDPTTWDGCAAHSGAIAGRGTAEQPYLICTAAQFASLGGDTPWWYDPAATTPVLYFVQMRDIDLSAQAGLAPIGPAATGANGFSGVYDGNGYALANFTIVTSENGGLFANVGVGHLARIAAVGGNVTSVGDSGLIVGDLFGAISDSYATGTISATLGSQEGVGGLCGSAHNVVGCYAAASVHATGGSGGGLAGLSADGPAYFASFAASTVTASSGAIRYGVAPPVGSSGDPDSQSYATYYDATLCSGCGADSFLQLTTANAFEDTSSGGPFALWDFANVWSEQSHDYPTLRKGQ